MPGRVCHRAPASVFRGGRDSILVPGDMIAALIKRREAIERFEFESLLDCQTDEDAFVNKIPPRRLLPEITRHAVRFHSRSRAPLEHQGSGRRPCADGNADHKEKQDQKHETAKKNEGLNRDPLAPASPQK